MKIWQMEMGCTETGLVIVIGWMLLLLSLLALFWKKKDIWTAGYRVWQHLNPSLHLMEFLLQVIERSLDIGGFIDDHLKKVIMDEKEKWHILKVILDTNLHCVKNNNILLGVFLKKNLRPKMRKIFEHN